MTVQVMVTQIGSMGTILHARFASPFLIEHVDITYIFSNSLTQFMDYIYLLLQLMWPSC